MSNSFEDHTAEDAEHDWNRDKVQERLDILAGLIDLECKVEACRLLRLKFIRIWDMLVASYETIPDLYEALKKAEDAISNEWLYQTGQFCRPQSNYPPQGSVHSSLSDAMGDITKALAKVKDK